MMALAPAPQAVSLIDWSTWRARDLATLVLVVEQQRVLLIRKQRGLGTGKITPPGGRIEHAETPRAAAARELKEELGITPRKLEYAGRNRFQFLDGYSLDVHVFRSDGYTGVVTESDEAIPLWTSVERIPFAQMWQDDALWLPLVLRRQRFSGRYIFDGDQMLDYELDQRRGPTLIKSVP